MLAVLAVEAIGVGCVLAMPKPPREQSCIKMDRAIRTIRYLISDDDLVARADQALIELQTAGHFCPDDTRYPGIEQELADALRREGTRVFREEAARALYPGDLEPAIQALKISLHLMNDPATAAELQAAEQAAFAIDAGMVQMTGGVWIDHSEHPNAKQKVGRQEAEALCQEAGKRLCTEAELADAGTKVPGFRCCL